MTQEGFCRRWLRDSTQNVEMFENEARMEGVQGRFPYDDLHLHDTCTHAAVSILSCQISNISYFELRTMIA